MHNTLMVSCDGTLVHDVRVVDLAASTPDKLILGGYVSDYVKNSSAGIRRWAVVQMFRDFDGQDTTLVLYCQDVKVEWVD